MPKEKRPKGKGESSSAGKITDPRFKNFEEDPRFRLPSKRSTKVKLDKRFSKLLEDEDNEFTSIAKVDRYGRKLKGDKKKKALQRLYRAEDEDEKKGKEDDSEDAREVDDDEIVKRELAAANKKYDPARHGGYSSSDDSSDEDEDEKEEQLATAAGLEKFQDQQADVETGDVTSRFAVVNLDWDHVSSIDLLALLKSFLPATGRVERVTVYPSSFGKERMAREDLEGPPKELFQKGREDEDDDEEDDDEEVKRQLLQEEEEQEFDNDALRTYQLERLRYYFAVVEFSDEVTAKAVYDKVDGTEYLSSSNFMDLRFVPDELTFDDEPRDVATEVPSSYKPIEFVTDALFNSKVKLSWDVRQDVGSRNDLMQRAFKGSRTDIAENDLKAYLASDSSDGGEEEDDFDDAEEEQEDKTDEVADEDEPPLSKKELARRKMRAALGLSDESMPKTSKSKPVGDMQITFTSALSEKTTKKAAEEETTIEKYKRKERERKLKKKEKNLAKREGIEPSGNDGAEAEEPEEDLGFDDPFFTSEEPVKQSNSAIRKEERLKKRAAKEAEAAENAAERAQLELIMADNADGAARVNHFNMNEIMRAEKEKKKGKKAKKSKKSKEERGGLQEDFNLDTGDSRFQAVFHEHEFAIDPSNPRFKETTSMKKLLEEGRNKRKAEPEDSGEASSRQSKKTKAGDAELSGLIKSIKKKTSRK